MFFPQVHRPGEAMQTDFTWATDLGVTIAGEPFRHMLCHPVLPYSNWEWVTVCQSESMAALKTGVQQALVRLGRCPEWHQTDNSTAATHELSSGKRGFNPEYEEFVTHYGMKPRTIAVGRKEQNGDTESSHGAFKRRLERELVRRGSRNFESEVEYERWTQSIAAKRNAGREAKVAEELAAIRPLPLRQFPEYSTVKTRVLSWSTISVKHNTYSVPSRLIGEDVTVHVYHDRLEVYFAGELQHTTARLRGEGGHRIQYRHVIRWLVRKPGAFERYRYRDDLFPSEVFRRAHEQLRAALPTRQADLQYLRVLLLAAETLESQVEAVLERHLDEGRLIDVEVVRAAVAPRQPEIPRVEAPPVDLKQYDELLDDTMEHAA